MVFNEKQNIKKTGNNVISSSGKKNIGCFLTDVKT